MTINDSCTAFIHSEALRPALWDWVSSWHMQLRGRSCCIVNLASSWLRNDSRRVQNLHHVQRSVSVYSSDQKPIIGPKRLFRTLLPTFLSYCTCFGQQQLSNGFEELTAHLCRFSTIVWAGAIDNLRFIEARESTNPQ
jgi:hypothetical protein